MGHSASAPWWLAITLAVLPALIALSGTIVIAVRQGKSLVAAQRTAQQNAEAADRSSRAADRASAVADRAAQNADRAAEKLDTFRLHEDTMRTLYWAADHAVVPDSGRALLGLEVLGGLVSQVDDDRDQRGGRIVRATAEAVKTVAIPTFISVLTNSSEDDGEGGGLIRVKAIEVNSAKLLLAHGHDLDTDLRAEIALIAEAKLGTAIKINLLHGARHVNRQLESTQESTLDDEHRRTEALGVSLER
jgi:hypothetical protein